MNISPASVFSRACENDVHRHGLDTGAGGRPRDDGVSESTTAGRSGRMLRTLDKEITLDGFIRQSPDAIETGRRRRSRDTILIDWKPKNAVVPYATDDHQYSWFPPGSHSEPALCSEFRCEKRTGTFVLEMITPQEFEAAVAFPRPGRSHMKSEKQSRQVRAETARGWPARGRRLPTTVNASSGESSVRGWGAAMSASCSTGTVSRSGRTC